MAITEADVRAALESFVEPYSQQGLAQAGALRAVQVQAGQAAVKVELGFPTVGYAHSLQSALQQHLAASGVNVELTLDLGSRIVPLGEEFVAFPSEAVAEVKRLVIQMGHVVKEMAHRES